jgi:hypothetical protein
MVTDSSLLVVWAILHIWVHRSVLYFYLFFCLALLKEDEEKYSLMSPSDDRYFPSRTAFSVSLEGIAHSTMFCS